MVKSTGDGALVEFASVVDAVRAALEIQRGMVARNADIPADRQIQYRIGINLRDVMVEADGDLMGDGVNVAARLEGIAEPGGICVSAAAYGQVKAKIDVTFADMGEQRLKNIAEPVRAYRVKLGEAKAGARQRSARKTMSRAAAVIVVLSVAVGGWLASKQFGAPPPKPSGSPSLCCRSRT
jgi:adenylate cyclase